MGTLNVQEGCGLPIVGWAGAQVSQGDNNWQERGLRLWRACIGALLSAGWFGATSAACCVPGTCPPCMGLLLCGLLSLGIENYAVSNSPFAEQILAFDAELENAFSTSQVSGTFTIRRDDGAASGDFTLLLDKLRFRFEFGFDNHEGFRKGLHHFSTRFNMIADGESILVGKFSKQIGGGGCDTDLYKYDGIDYLATCPFSPIEPHFLTRLFTMPPLILGQLDGGDRIGNLYVGEFDFDSYSKLEFKLAPDMDYACVSLRLITKESGKTSFEMERNYRRDGVRVVPVNFRETYFDPGESIFRETQLRFDKVNFTPPIEEKLFTVNGIDFCRNARIVDRSGKDSRIVHSYSENGFRASPGESIRETVEVYAGREREVKEAVGTHGIISIRTVVCFLVAIFFGISVYLFYRK